MHIRDVRLGAMYTEKDKGHVPKVVGLSALLLVRETRHKTSETFTLLYRGLKVGWTWLTAFAIFALTEILRFRQQGQESKCTQGLKTRAVRLANIFLVKSN